MRSTFALANPHTCPHCGGTTIRVSSGYVAVPDGNDEPLGRQYSITVEEQVDQFMRELEEWDRG